MTMTVFFRTAIGMAAGALLFGLSGPLHAKDFIKAERPQLRGYSLAVITDDAELFPEIRKHLGGEFRTSLAADEDERYASAIDAPMLCDTMANRSMPRSRR